MTLTGPKVLDLLTNTAKPLTGQHLPEWQSAWTSMSQYVTPLGDTPAILAIDWRINANDDTTNNQSITDVAWTHIQNGGVIGIAPHFASPFGTDQTITGTWGTKGDHAQLLAGAPNSTAKTRWQGNIDRLNALLDKLGADAPVIFHPFHEANGNWFWWGYNSANPSRSSTGLASLYNDTMNRLHIVERGYVRGFQWGASWYAPMSFGYPGSGNVDVVGSSLYKSAPEPLTFINKFEDDWTRLKSYGKPILIFEGGPQPLDQSQVNSPQQATAAWDAFQMSDKMLDKYPGVKSTIMWHPDYKGFGPWSSFTNGKAAFNSSRLARLSDIKVATPPAPEPTEKTVFTALRNPVVGVYSSEAAAWAAGDDVIAVTQSDIQE